MPSAPSSVVQIVNPPLEEVGHLTDMPREILLQQAMDQWRASPQSGPSWQRQYDLTGNVSGV